MRPKNSQGLANQQRAVDVVAFHPEPAVFAGCRIVAQHKKLIRFKWKL
jgi:hypothetical protein